MAMVINTNISSLNAQRQLAGSANKLGTAMERLSSGLRINSAKDDAAGLAIASRMTTQITGLNVAQRNANDGISLAQTAEGAMASIGNNLQRIRELAVQSRNATNSDEDREALQKEVTQLVAEIDRVADNTKFNGTNLLNGSFTSKEFQVGADQGQTIKIDSIASMKKEALGSWKSAAEPKVSDAMKLKDGGLTPANTTAATTISMSIGGVTVSATIAARTGSISTDEIAEALDTAIAAATMTTGISVEGKLADGTFKVSNANTAATTVSITGFTDALMVGTAASGTGSSSLAAGVASESKTGFAGLDIKTVAGADNAILAMDAALKSVNSARADLGAIQNRFESVVSNLATTAENLTASRSRILDADFAVETANLSSAQVLQQAGTAMVAQANQLPQNVLSLLR